MIYERKDSRFWWMLLERPGLPSLKESTKIPKDAPDSAGRKIQRQQAEEIYRARMNTLARSRYDLPVDNPTIGFTAWADWFDKHHLGQRRGAPREREILARLKAFFGQTDLTTITRQSAQEYITARLADVVPNTKQPVQPNTVNREVDVLKAVLREAVPKYFQVNPLLGMKRLRVVKQKKGRTITPAEERRLLEALRPADRVLYIVAADTLVRLSNVVNLKWSEVKNNRLVLEDSKTGPYEVPLSKRAQDALKELPKAGDYCFPARRNAKTPRDQRGAIRKMLRGACKRCSPPIPYGRGVGITFHTSTRATGATRMLREGTDLRIVQQVGNWKDIRSVQAYLAADTAAARRAVNRIGKRVTET